MAQQIIVQYIDDIDGTVNDSVETVYFALDGVSYEIDLGAANSGKLRQDLAGFIGKARRVGGRARRTAAPSSTTTKSKADTEAIREWAKANGHAISDRGRIPTRVLEAYAEVRA